MRIRGGSRNEQGNSLQKETLAVLMKNRSSKIPNVPTMTEAGFPEMNDIDWDAWFGIFVKKGTPQAVINRLNEASRRFLSDAKSVTRLDGGTFHAYPPTDAREAQARWERNFVSARVNCPTGPKKIRH